ncbi:unnamed protein product [Linum tenue]|uniref:Phosphoglycerate mutase-like protein 4 n=1 Tax=Linum tenue TaxID=586396 RepID=A0AAV0R960_9ROSI|nr:unnamed protein product [Linum tenue]
MERNEQQESNSRSRCDDDTNKSIRIAQFYRKAEKAKTQQQERNGRIYAQMTTLRNCGTIQLPRQAFPPRHSITLLRHLTLPVAGSFTPRLVSVRRRSGRRPILFVETDVPESVSMTDSNSIPSSAHPAYTEIVVVRHGETEWNADKRIQGHVDVDLNEVGRQQAALVIFQVIKEPGLRERHLGDLQGLSLSEAAKASPEAYDAFLSHKTSQDIPGGGESLDKLYERSTSSFQRIAAKHRGERVVVVSHGGTIRSLHKRACPSERPAKILNTSVHIFHISDVDEWTIKSWGDVSHLNQTGFLESGFGGDRTSEIDKVLGDLRFDTTYSDLIPHIGRWISTIHKLADALETKYHQEREIRRLEVKLEIYKRRKVVK